MSNEDLYNKALKNNAPIEAARLALRFAGNCSSRSRCWGWTDRAISAAAMAGIQLLPGNLSWPDIDAMEQQLAPS